MISRELCVPKDVDIDRFIDAAIENDRFVIIYLQYVCFMHLVIYNLLCDYYDTS
jgi:hypothetical protein